MAAKSVDVHTGNSDIDFILQKQQQSYPNLALSN